MGMNMDFKTYQKEIQKINQFDKAFKPWTKWQNTKLTAMCPCSICAVSKELENRQYEVQMSGGLQEEITEPCGHCMDSILWKMECLEKLAWYENDDERLNGKND